MVLGNFVIILQHVYTIGIHINSIMKHIIPVLLVIISYNSKAQSKIVVKKNYTITYPAAWNVAASSTNAACSIEAPSDGAGDAFVENINLTSSPIKGYTAATYAAFSKGYLPKKIKNFTVLEEKAITTNGTPGYYMVFKGLQGKDKLQWKQYYYIHNNTIYILTLTAEQAKYANYITQVQPSLQSFTIK